MPHTRQTLEKMAGEIFELYRLIAIARSRRPSGHDDLSETEFLALDILYHEQPLTIGDIQKHIGVLPAQMSRIVRALEEQGGRGYVACGINPHDRRRVDVSLTPAGKKAYENYRVVRLGSMHEILSVLSPDDRLHFMRILRQIQVAFAARINIDKNTA
ncbi:MAG: MarR family winged helix-turn-helix transcriptional regulator [Phycisphaerae bacterium]